MPDIKNYEYETSYNEINSYLFFLISTIICLVPLTISYLAYYPGGMNLDALGQWWQVQDKFLNDWHPTMSTLLIFLITRIHNSFAFYILVQILVLSLSIGYLSISLKKAGVPFQFILVFVAYFALNPATLTIGVSMLKDTMFAIFAIFLIGQLISIWRTNGLWFKKKVNIALLVLTLLGISFMRHNGLFLSVPICFFLFLYKGIRKNIVITVVLFACLSCIIKGPLYSTLNVVSHENVVGESMGVPMAVLGNELVNSPETIDKETHTFLNTIATDEEWNEHYIVGEWDSVKWDFGGTELLRNIDAITILKYTIKSVLRAPKCALESFSRNTRVITILVGRADWAEEPYVSENEYGIEFNGVPFLNFIMHKYVTITSQPFISTLFWCLGVFLVVMLILLIRTIVRKEFYKLVLIVPILVYDAGTALLLCGPSFRYFFFNIPLTIAVALIVMSKNSKQESGS